VKAGGEKLLRYHPQLHLRLGHDSCDKPQTLARLAMIGIVLTKASAENCPVMR